MLVGYRYYKEGDYDCCKGQCVLRAKRKMALKGIKELRSGKGNIE